MATDRFGALPDGTPVTAYTLRNAHGLEVRVLDYGAIIASISVPDRDGVFGDVALGFDTLDGYLADNPYLGAVVGRYGNRIAGGRFMLDGVEYRLAINDGANHLHGGVRGFDKVPWQAEASGDGDHAAAVALHYVSSDGEEGYPATLSVSVTYTLGDDNELRVDYFVRSDAPTPANLTQHSYFNLAGGGDILDHQLWIGADRYTPVDATLIPTGELASVEGTPFDFRVPTAIGARIDAEDPQLAIGGGYDHNFVLGAEIGPGTAVALPEGRGLVHAARATDLASGRVLDVFTSEPGLQLYSGNFLDGTLVGKGGAVYGRRSGFCLETQHFPDSPNQSGFPSTIVRPGAPYRSRTVFRFSTDR